MIEASIEHRVVDPSGQARTPGAANTGTGGPAGQQLSLWRALFGGGRGHVALFSCLAGPRNPAGTLLAPRSAYFPYPGCRAEALAWVHRGAAAGREVHFCPHLLTGRRRVKENAARIRALWADADEAELPAGFPEPTVSVRSSPGKRHLYWALRRALRPEEAEQINRRLTRTIGADPGGWALASLLRLPGTTNQKYPAQTRVTLLTCNRKLRYHPREIELYLKDLGETVPGNQTRVVPHESAYPPQDLLTADDLDRLSPRMRALISLGNEAAGEPYKSRSEADFAVAVAMVGAGFSEEAVYAVLTDPANGISEKYREKGRHGPGYLKLTIDEAKRRAEPAYRTPAFGKARVRRSAGRVA